ncbi:KdsC family phosphatase [Pseudohongiella spirulinae]|uniref:3-deoxy-D-manno-octulosonate 8-phosphate phosphatase KdsC n=1 Tax=Pseudohongiella spirulinae TaxID=1249552 RepID=A0A0S2KF35_9GAMM|nr:HAD hydrolase family protein [Pseudohongiella spirulinae]ALO46967.1 3-deoxy-D-manno-octulosonate 8-phosphate phosphatase [Pseudohongiella spirulinae]
MQYTGDKQTLDQRAKNIRLLVLDVDGVLTDGQLYFSEQGESLKAFNTLDGHGIKLLQANGIQVAIISGRRSAALERRATALGITLLWQGREDKLNALQELLQNAPYAPHEIACVGDDLPDLPIMLASALAITVPNAHASLRQYASLCTERPGGQGAVREVADYLLQSQGKYQDILDSYTS